MFVEFESPNEDHHQAYFGVNDIEPFSDGNAWMIWFPGGDNRKVTGVTVRRVIAEGYKNTRDLIEELYHYAGIETYDLTIAIDVQRFSATLRAAEELIRDNDTDITAGDFTFLGDTDALRTESYHTAP